MYFFIPLFRPGLWNPHPFSDLASKKLFHHYFDWNKNKKDFTFTCISFFLPHLELKPWIRSYTPTSFLENHTRFQTQMGKDYTRFQTKTAQEPYPLGRHIHIWLIYGSTLPPPGFSLFPKKIKAWGLYLQASSLSILAWYREKVGMWPLQMYAVKIKILTFNSCTIRWKFYS